MGNAPEPRYNVYVILLGEYVGTLPQMRRRNPKRGPSKPCVYIGLTPLPVGRRFDFRRATPKLSGECINMAFRSMPELYENLNSMLLDYCERSAAWVFEIGTGNKNADRILAALRAAAEKGLTKGLIHPVLPFALVI